MKIVFLSNYYNHHQAPFSESMARLTHDNYVFIETEKMSKERELMGWSGIVKPTFVMTYSEENSSVIKNLIEDADAVIIGSAPIEMISSRLKSGKLVFRYSERWYKNGFQKWKWPIRFIRDQHEFGQYRNLYLLCASAYTAADCAKTGLFRNKAYKWGYFPEVIRYENLEKMIDAKKKASLLWVGRLIGWKHPDASIRIAERLKNEGYIFSLNIIGNGELEQDLRQMVADKELADCVNFLGSMTPVEVRSYMEQSQIYLFTSDFNEGWGAVLNESMNSACAVVASHAIGSVPYLIKDAVNGVIFENENEDQLFEIVKSLLDHPKECNSLGAKAYYTLTDSWNADVAAERLLRLIDDLQRNGWSDRYEDGPCSKAEILQDGWYKL